MPSIRQHAMALTPIPAHPASIPDRIKPLYILPLFANLAIIASVSSLCGLIGEEMYEESQFPLPHWLFFASSVVFAPTVIAVCKVLPDPSHSLCAGGFITTIGLLWSSLATGHQQMFIFGILVGCGVILSFTSTCISLAPYFVRRSKTCAVWILLASAIITVGAHSAIRNLLEAVGTTAFISLCPVVLITSMAPFITRVWLRRRNHPDQTNCSRKDDLVLNDAEAARTRDDSSLTASGCDQPTGEVSDSVCHCIKQRFRSMTFQDGWMVSVVSVIVWLFWGAGVDTTWHCMLSSSRLDASWLGLFSTTSTSMGQNIILIQLLLSMVVLLIKGLTEPKSSSTPSSSLLSSPPVHAFPQPMDRLVFGCNYMFLGFLGVGGLLAGLYPGYTIPFHNHLIFAMGFALQFDDLCDLKAEDGDGVEEKGLQRRARMIRGITLKQIDKLEPKKSGLDLCCVVCHLLSLFMMSCLAMLLGLQISNGMMYVLTAPPFAYVFSSAGLVLVSTVSIVLSLAQPDTWL